MSKGKCKYCGKEVYEIIYKGNCIIVEISDYRWGDGWKEHTCLIRDVKK